MFGVLKIYVYLRKKHFYDPGLEIRGNGDCHVWCNTFNMLAATFERLNPEHWYVSCLYFVERDLQIFFNICLFDLFDHLSWLFTSH